MDLEPGILSILRNRSWLSGCLTASVRCIQIATQTGGWFGKKVRCEEEGQDLCYGDYNDSLMDDLQPLAGHLLIAFHLLFALACILAFKWRSIADYFFIAISFIETFAWLNINHATYKMDYGSISIRIVLHYLQFAMGQRSDILINAISIALQCFFGVHLVYARPLTVGSIILYTLTVIISMLVATPMSMAFVYFSEITNRLQVTQKSSVNLLNGMHEGILILSETSMIKSRYFLYANRSAQKLINKFVGPLD